MNMLERIQRAKDLCDTSLLDETDLTSEVDDKLTKAYWARCHNDAQMELQNILIQAAQDYFTKTKEITITSGTQEYSLPADTIQIRSLERVDDTYGDYNLFPISINDRNKLSTDRNTSTLTDPRLVYFFGMKFGLVDYQAGGTVNALYIKRLPDTHYGTAASAAAGTITLAETPDLGKTNNMDDYYKDAKVKIISATAGAGQIETISDYVGSTRVATLSANWDTTPTGTIVYEIQCEIPENHHLVLSSWMAMDGYITGGLDVPKSLSEKYLKSEDAMLKAFIPRQSLAPRHVARPYTRPWEGLG